jgi:tetratricopeptide (TPR) repeat protein
MTEPTASTDALLQALDTRFAAHRAAVATPPDDSEQPCLRAAAVLHVFAPSRLRPAGATPDAGDLAALLRHSVSAVGWRHEGLRTLRLKTRRSALRALGSRAAMRAALDANPGRTLTGVQRQFERWLDGERFMLERMAYFELEDFRQLYEWGLDDLGGLPPVDQVERALVRRSAVAVFEHLVDRDFVGRSRELRTLRDRLQLFDSRQPRGPLAIWGVGGIEKTALIARFLVEHVEAPEREWFPFAYLPFDSETLDVREPFTLLVAMAAQFDAQAGSLGDTWANAALVQEQLRRFREAVDYYRDRRGSLQRRASEFAERGGRIASLSSTELQLYDAFADLLKATAGRSPNELGRGIVLLVFDTFEEVVYRAAEDLLGFWSMLDRLQERVPQLRVVLAGRGRQTLVGTDRFPSTELLLDDLSHEDAVRLLTRLGVDDIAVARAVAYQVGGNPLSLRLAARVACEEHPGPSGIQSLSTQNIGAELVRGQLYRRLLDHIHNEDVRVLAHPGMVLRRVTPQIIKDVLAPACALEHIDDARAHELFDGLRREQVLVSLEEDGSLRYREEVRRPVLKLLERDLPTQVRDIHSYAVQHYFPLGTPVDRAEELYHRIMLHQSAYVLADRWLTGVEQYLASAIDELPPEQLRWLAGKMSIELRPEVYRLADVAEWERLIGRKATEVVRHSGPEAALNLLHERAERTRESPLFAIEARALLDLKQPMQAAQLLNRALADFPALGNPGRLAEILWLRAQASAALGEPEACLEFLRRLTNETASIRSALAQVQALTEILGILNPQDVTDVGVPEIGMTRHKLSEALGRLAEAEVDQERSLVRLALVRLGPHYPALIADLARSTIFDLSYFARAGLVDLIPAVQSVAESLNDEWPELRDLAANPRQADIETLISVLVDTLAQQSKPDATEPRSVTPLAEAVLVFLRTEGTSLSGSSLAGLDDYREPWELESTREVAS